MREGFGRSFAPHQFNSLGYQPVARHPWPPKATSSACVSIETVPRQVREIIDRLDEIAFNGSLVKELRALALIRRLLREDGADPEQRRAPLFRQIAALRLHRIEAAEDLARLGATNRHDAGWTQLSRLHRLGREAAQAWIEHCFSHLGRRSTLPLEPFLEGIAP